MKILSFDTSCDETAVAVTDGLKILSNTVWSQASLHSKFGGIYPSLAQREHKSRIDWVIKRSLVQSFGVNNASSMKYLNKEIDAISVNTGPGLAIALGVGIDKAKEWAKILNKPLLSANHIEAHLLSPFAQSKNNKNNTDVKKQLPAIGLILSGGTTQIVYVEEIGKYEVLAKTVDDALGEALDKGARLLGFGYPGGAILEKIAKSGNSTTYPLPIPMRGKEQLHKFSYSGLKTALVRKHEELKSMKTVTKKDISDLASSYQHSAFSQVENVLENILSDNKHSTVKTMLLGGGVGANSELRKRLRNIAKKHNLIFNVPYTKKLYGDNAAMIGVATFLRIENGRNDQKEFDEIDRNARQDLTCANI